MTPEIVEGRYGAAEAAATAARKVVRDALVAESKALLDQLLKKSVKERFEELEKPNLKLIPADRRKLVRSLQDGEPPRREIVATMASRLEIWRSRLPYRVFPMAVLGISFAVAVFLAATAYRHTPQEWVAVATSQTFSIQASGPDGYTRDLDVSPGERYALIRVEGGQGILRYWLPGQGYAEFRLPVENLRKAP